MRRLVLGCTVLVRILVTMTESWVSSQPLDFQSFYVDCLERLCRDPQGDQQVLFYAFLLKMSSMCFARFVERN